MIVKVEEIHQITMESIMNCSMVKFLLFWQRMWTIAINFIVVDQSYLPSIAIDNILYTY